MNTIETAKKMLRAQHQGDQYQKLCELRASHPQESTEQLMARLEALDREGCEYARRLESGEAWQPPKALVYRFVDDKKYGTSRSFPAALKSFMPQKVEGVELVHAAHQEKEEQAARMRCWKS
jgi:hypothetical protein